MKTTKQNINEIKRIAKSMPKSINEAVYEEFSDANSDLQPEDDMRKKMAVPAAQGPVADGPQGEDEPSAPAVDNGAVEAPVVDTGAADMGAAADMGEEKEGEDSLNVEQFVDDIRKKSLRGMAQLAENPDDERYQLLKKIWQICDKKPEQQTAFSNPNQVPQKKI